MFWGKNYAGNTSILQKIYLESYYLFEQRLHRCSCNKLYVLEVTPLPDGSAISNCTTGVLVGQLRGPPLLLDRANLIWAYLQK